MLCGRIREICEDKGMSIRSLERKANLSNGAISKWENSSPSVDNVKAVADVLGVKVDELLAAKPKKKK